MSRWAPWIAVRNKKRRLHIRPCVVFLNGSVEIPEMHLYLGQSRRFYRDGREFKWWKFWRWPDTCLVTFHRDGRVTVETDWYTSVKRHRMLCLATIIPKDIERLLGKARLPSLAEQMIDESKRTNVFTKFFAGDPLARFEWDGRERRKGN